MHPFGLPGQYRRLVGSNVAQDRPANQLKRGRKGSVALKRDFRCPNSAYGLVLNQIISLFGFTSDREFDGNELSDYPSRLE